MNAPTYSADSTFQRETLSASREVHIWSCDLSRNEYESAAAALLSAEEKVRASRFRFEMHRRRFTLGRATLRMLLASYLGNDPSQIVFEYGSFGKPGLMDQNLYFNLSHTEDLAVIAISARCRVGIDAESVTQRVDSDTLIASFASAKERFAFEALSPKLRSSAFWYWWTRKEAVMKAWGTGHSRSLDSFDVSLIAGDTHLPASRTADHSQIFLYDLPLGEDYVGALAHCDVPASICRKEFDTNTLLL